MEDEHISKFTHNPAEIPEVRMEAHEQPAVGAVQAPPVPTMSYLAAAAWANAELAPITGVPQTTGVISTDVVNLTGEEDDDDRPAPTKIKEETTSTMDKFEKGNTRKLHRTMAINIPVLHMVKERE